MKWIILSPFNDGVTTEWEVAGTVACGSEAEAITVAADWPDIRHRDALRAVPWDSASRAVREDAVAEDRVRHESEEDYLQRAVGMLMMGVTTAFIVDFAVLRRALDSCLSRSLSDQEESMVMFAYAALLYDASCQVGERSLTPSNLRALRRRLQVEFPALLSSGSTSTMPTDEWIDAVAPFQTQFSRNDVETPEYCQGFGSFIAEIVGSQGDPEIIGRLAVIASSTIVKLRLRDLMRLAAAPGERTSG